MRAPLRPIRFAAFAAVSLLLLALLALVACSKSDSGTSPAGSASASLGAPTTPSGGACDVVTCMNFSGSPGYAAGKTEALPSVPQPPSGSSLCGGSGSFRSNYYTTSQSPDQIVAYYEKELPSRGFTLKPRHAGVRACSLELSFHKAGMEIGNITAFVGGFGVMYAGK